MLFIGIRMLKQDGHFMRGFAKIGEEDDRVID